MDYLLKFRSPNLCTIMIVAKVKTCFLKKKERVKGFFIFMNMLSFKQVESNNDLQTRLQLDQVYSLFEFRIPLIWYYFSNSNSKWLYTLHSRRKKIYEVNNF